MAGDVDEDNIEGGILIESSIKRPSLDEVLVRKDLRILTVAKQYYRQIVRHYPYC